MIARLTLPAIAGRVLLALALLLSAATTAAAVQPDEMLKDPKLEARAREISRGLRCLVCQNQSIDDSNAPLARDLRLRVRDRLLKGDTNEQVMAYIHERYGDFVLLKPPLKPVTYLLWFGPPALLVVSILALFLRYRRRRLLAEAARPAPLSAEEKARLDRLLGDTGKEGRP